MNIIKNIRSDRRTVISHRRKLAVLSVAGLVNFSIISLYQLGVVRSLPDLPGKVFNSNQINASKSAIIFGLPDGPVSLSMYAMNLILIAASARQTKKGTSLITF